MVIDILYNKIIHHNIYVLYLQGERPLYLQFDPSKALLARAVIKTLGANKLYYASILIEDDYATDGFLQTFGNLTQGPPWLIEDQIIVSKKHSTEAIDCKLHALLENKSRVLILHASPKLAQRVFQVARENGFTNETYAWFVTEDVKTSSNELLDDYPIGLLAFVTNYHVNFKLLLHDAVHLVSKATNRYIEDRGDKLLQYVDDNACNTPTPTTADQYNQMKEYYRYVYFCVFNVVGVC